MEDLNVAIRLKGFIDSEGLSHSQFADQCGIPRPSLSQILSGRNKKISDVIVGQIHKAFPNLSVLWLLFGEGEMLVPDGKSVSGGSQNVSFTDEGSDFTGISPAETAYPNVRGLTEPSAMSQNADIKHLDLDLKIGELQKQIDKLRQNPRKVSHITVYYDDSTFETFYPKS